MEIFFENAALKGAVEHCKKKDSALHFMGLLSDGGVHSHIEHIYGLLELAKRAGLKKVYLHAFWMEGILLPTPESISLCRLKRKCRKSVWEK